jgi:hypothetical protein
MAPSLADRAAESDPLLTVRLTCQSSAIQPIPDCAASTNATGNAAETVVDTQLMTGHYLPVTSIRQFQLFGIPNRDRLTLMVTAELIY